MKSYRVCTRCIMDTTDPDIVFDAEGVCNYCHAYDEVMRAYSRLSRAESICA